jgi:hypothetical protein
MHVISVIDLFELWWLGNLVLNILAFDILSLFITLITLKKKHFAYALGDSFRF